jgi:hypothetical protein
MWVPSIGLRAGNKTSARRSIAIGTKLIFKRYKYPNMRERLVKGKFVPISISLVLIFMICISALSQVQTKDDVQYSAAIALGQINDTRAVEPLIQALKDNDSNVRYGAAIALGQINDTRAVEPLIQALKDNDSNVRYGAATALGQII